MHAARKLDGEESERGWTCVTRVLFFSGVAFLPGRAPLTHRPDIRYCQILAPSCLGSPKKRSSTSPIHAPCVLGLCVCAGGDVSLERVTRVQGHSAFTEEGQVRRHRHMTRLRDLLQVSPAQKPHA